MPLSQALDDLLQFCASDARVCPQPTPWNELWALLPKREQRADGSWHPPVPLILAAWRDSSNLAKAGRLRVHIEWAAEHGALAAVDEFLRTLKDSEWFYGHHTSTR